LARNCISVDFLNLKVIGPHRGRIVHPGASPVRVEWVNRGQNTTLCRRGNSGTIKLGCDFHPHDFEEHADPPTIVQLRETTKGLREGSRHYAHLLADLETIIKANDPGAFT